MNYNKLKYFYEISKVQNLSRAAELLYVSQPSLSKAISDLEKEFGTPLFIRTNRNLVLTQAGIVLQKQLEPVFANEQNIYAAVRAASLSSQENLTGQLTVDFMCFEEALGLHSFIHQFQQAHPAIEVHAFRSQKKDLIKKMTDHAVDVGFMIFSIDDFHSDYEYKVLREHHLSLIVRNDHPLAGRNFVDISEVRNEPMIAHGHKKNSNEYAYSFGWAIRNGLHPNIVAEYDYVETVLLQVSYGAGITLLSDAAPFSGFSNLVNVPLNNAPIIYTGIFWNPNGNSAAAKLFVHEYLMRNSIL